MALASSELYELFLSLSAARLGTAKLALAEKNAHERRAQLIAALAPIAVDAGLLGAEGVSALASAIARAEHPEPARVRAALSELERAIAALGVSDASGARVNETELLNLARALLEHGATGFTLLADDAAPESAGAGVRASPGTGESDDDSRWVPGLAEDMVGAFLDECVERTEGLAERLMELEQRGTDKELVSAVFRDLHTLKGSSAFAGLTKLNRVAHRAEDLIGELRDGKRPADRPLIDVLLQALDAMRAITEKARAGAVIDTDIGPLLERLANPNRVPSPAESHRSTPNQKSAAEQTASTALSPPAQARTSDGQGTLRIEFEKVDRLLNLVGEIVLARSKLAGAAEVQGMVVREVAQLRRKLSDLSEAPRALASGSDIARVRPAFSLENSAILEDLERTERVLRETFGEVDSGLGGLGIAVGQLRDTVMKLRMVPIARLFTKYQRTVRELSHKLGKEVSVELSGGETELDKVLVERLEDPLLHLVRNAVDHGVELPEDRALGGKPREGLVRLSASQRGGQILVTISDDGRGLDPDKLKRKAVSKAVITQAEADELSDEAALELIFYAGFSTAEQLSDVSGRGVGMDVVRDAIQKLKGNVKLSSKVGEGTSVELSLPLTLAITQVLTARVGGELVAIPLDAVVSAQTLQQGQLEPLGMGSCLRIGERLIPVFDLADVLGLSDSVALGEADAGSVVIVSVGSSELGLCVQQVLGRHEVVIKSLGSMLAEAPCAAGAAVVGDRMVLVLDLADTAQRAQEPARSRLAPASRARVVRSDRARVLVAEDSDVIREAIRRELTQAGFDVTTAVDGEEALRLAREQPFDAVSSDVMMPNRDGYELVRALRAEPKYRDVPIVLVTSKDARIDAVRGYDAGADAYLTKPADAEELIHTLDALLRARRRPR
ncbi:MAG TPA: response regulator [Polyangiaceae bacterium]|nr:response regulator [Polyangiaceae bacterium]